MTNEDLIRDLDLAQIDGFDGYYVDIYGDVYSTRKFGYSTGEGPLRKLAPQEVRGGYLQVTLCVNGNRYGKPVHRLVAETFIPNPEHLLEVNHLDGNRQNNFVENLEWCTRQENIRHSFDVLHRKPNINNAKAVKLTDKKTGETILFRSGRECARHLNMSQPYLSQLLTRRHDFNKWSLNTRYSVEFAETDE